MKRKPGKQQQRGFTLVELIISTCILAVLASIAISQMRDYTRRARVSEVVMATSQCKNTVSESYMVRDTAPDAGSWGCEKPDSSGYAGAVQTSSNGVIRVSIKGLDPLMNGRHVYLVPARHDGAAMVTPNDLGRGVTSWICGSDWQPVRNALPGNCHFDTTGYASQDYE